MSLSDNRKELLERLIRQVGTVIPGKKAAIGPRVEPASYGQRRLLFLEQLQQTEVPYNLRAVQHLQFAISPPLLKRAISAVIERHEVLRTTFELQTDEPLQKIASEIDVPLPIVDLTDLSVPDRQPEALRQMGLSIARRFDLEHGPLLRTELYRLGEQEWLFLLAVHHIVFDAPSFRIFFNELEAVYTSLLNNQSYVFPMAAAQYSEFARAQRNRLTPQRIEEEVNFWRAELAGVPMLDLPTDQPRLSVQSFRGQHKRMKVSAAVVAQLQKRAVAEKTTLFTVLLAGLYTAFSRICGQDDFAFGLPVTGRDSSESHGAIGFYVDTVVVRTRMHGDLSTSELIRAVSTAVNRSLSHRSLPFEMLVQHLLPVRDFGVNPYFQVGFQLMPHPVGTETSGALDIARSSTMFDLCLDLWNQGSEIDGLLQYSTDLFDPQTIELFLRTYLKALDWLVEPQHRLSEFDIGLGDAAQDVSILRGEKLEFHERSCFELIAEMARNHPDLPAIEGIDGLLSYHELSQRTEQQSFSLHRRGLGHGSLVALNLQRSMNLICLQLALLRSGAAFTCLDPAWPEGRRNLIINEIYPQQTVIDAAGLAAMLAESEPAILQVGPNRDDIAYVIFTSGSTGQPKGVVIEHRGLLNVAHAQRLIFGLTPGRRVAQLASPTFDASIFETVLALCCGVTLVVAPPEILAGEELSRFINSNRVDTIVLPPALLATMEPAACPSLRLICVAGESCSSDLAKRWKEGLEFWNLYGPTETTIWATYGRSLLGSKVTIGRPIPNSASVVVDPFGRIVPVGVAGELCITGMGLVRGYLNRPDLTRERFAERTQAYLGRLYKTGDVVRQTHSGELVFLGRVDRQVKVRGFRIEPEEVEVVLRSHPLVSEVVVDAFSIDGGEPTLIAYLQCSGDVNDIVEACRRIVRERLPLYMFPSHFVALDSFPRTSSGNINIKALPIPTETHVSDIAYVEPATPTERRIADLFMRTTHVSRVSASDDFSHIGGHSLAAARLVAQARVIFKTNLTIRDVFLYSTISALASRVDELMRDDNGAWDLDEVPLVRLPRGQPNPLDLNPQGGAV